MNIINYFKEFNYDQVSYYFTWNLMLNLYMIVFSSNKSYSIELILLKIP